MAAKDISLDTIKLIIRVDGTDFDAEIKDKINAAVGFIISAGVESDDFVFDTDVYDQVDTTFDHIDRQIIDLIQSYVRVMFGYDSNNEEKSIPSSWNLRLNQVILAYEGLKS